MPLNDGDKLNRLEELKTKLFSKDYHTKSEHRSSFSHPQRTSDVPDSWPDSDKAMDGLLGYGEKFFMKTTAFKKFFIFSIVAFILALGYAGYVMFFSGNTVSNDNIDISISGNSFTAGGEELALLVGITNRNNSALNLVDLVVEYPKGGGGGTSAGMERLRESLGTIAAGGTRNENIKLILFGEQGSKIPIKVSIEYRIEGSNAIFVKTKNYEVTVSSTPINLSVDAPFSISPNQEIALNIKSKLNATAPVPNIMIKVDYPVGFVFTSSIPEPTIGNNIWNMGDLAPGVERNVSISGKMVGVFDGEEKSFHVFTGEQSDSDKSSIGTVFNALTHTVLVKKPFIEARLAINGIYQNEYAVSSQNPIQGQINWTNNLDTRIDDMVIQAKISGNAFDKETVSAEQGIYDSLQSTMTWDKFSLDKFAEINPGESGSVNFSITPLPLSSDNNGILSSPSITIEVSLSGKQLTEGYSPASLSNSDSKTIKIISDAGLAAKALYYSGPFTNTGPIPPKPETETTYTIVWTLSNTANDISKAKVTAVLPAWVRFAGTVSPPQENLAYNSSTREVTWEVGKLARGTGTSAAERTVAFQVVLTPLFSQVSTSPTLINEAVLTGHDDFANVDIRASKFSLRTDLTNDSAFPAGGGVVTQ